MIKVSVLYPKSDGKRFDLDYYCAEHMRIVKDCLGDACKKIEVDAGLSGAAPGSDAPYFAMGHMLFDSVDEFQNAFGPHVDTIMSDIPNYTNVEPVVLVSEVKA